MAQKKQKKGKKILGAAVAATAAGVAAGYYFYASPDAKKNRKIAAKWASDLKSEVVKRAKSVGTIDRKSMMAIVDSAAAAYENVRGMKRADLERAGKELKDNWQDIAATFTKGMEGVRSSGKKTVSAVKRGTAKAKAVSKKHR